MRIFFLIMLFTVFSLSSFAKLTSQSCGKVRTVVDFQIGSDQGNQEVYLKNGQSAYLKKGSQLINLMNQAFIHDKTICFDASDSDYVIFSIDVCHRGIKNYGTKDNVNEGCK